MKQKILIAFVVMITLASCSTKSNITKLQQYPLMYEEKPLAILVMPPINRSTKVDAKELLYSSLVVPLSQKGYYVLPPLLTMEILKEESAYDSELFVNNSMKQVGDLFGVDAVLFTTIHEWEKITMAFTVRVVVEYTLKSTHSDKILFSRKGNITYNPNADTGNAFADLVSNMLSTALTKEIELGRKCNTYTISDMPAGRYSSSWNADQEIGAGNAEFSISLD